MKESLSFHSKSSVPLSYLTNHTSRSSRLGEDLLVAFSWLPLLWSFGLVFFAIIARINTGHWPRPGFPDPKSLPFPTLYSALEVTMFVVLATLLIVPALRVSLGRPSDWRRMRRAIQIFGAGWIAILVLLVARPIDFLMWFLD